jgi:outer membrane protein OmpA-like peptidoglycan-associated protein
LALSSQNLIKNPSFEAFENCPERLGNFDADVVSWSTPTDGSTDYFNACSTTMGTPKNFNGEQPSDFGKGYAGLYIYAPDDYREYLQAELARPLEEGKEYHISFFVSLAERSDFAVKEFGVLFAKNKLKIPIKKELSKRHWYRQKGNAYHYLEIGYTNFYSDTQDWIRVNTRFIAKGTERCMILGNFENNVRTRKFETKRNAQQGAYYYVDRVEVKAADSSDTEEESFALNEIHIFKNVLFEFDHFEILETGKLELRRIFDYLEARPNVYIAINGHTDSVGTEKYNQWLSGKRAQAVADFLIRMGIPKNRIAWQGHGDAKPIAPNTTEAGRKRNRRVEFVISNPNTP